MPLIQLETAPNVWEEREVSYDERRRLLTESDCLHRWVDENGRMYLTFIDKAASVTSGQTATSDPTEVT